MGLDYLHSAFARLFLFHWILKNPVIAFRIKTSDNIIILNFWFFSNSLECFMLVLIKSHILFFFKNGLPYLWAILASSTAPSIIGLMQLPANLILPASLSVC